jgi:1,4-alpha-glucan branching enzyme
MKTRLSKNKPLPEVNPRTQFALQAPTATRVSLAGDFNNWDIKASPMHKGPDGAWHLGLPLGPGRYEYRFFADGVWCDDPTAPQRARNSMGTENCVRIV